MFTMNPNNIDIEHWLKYFHTKYMITIRFALGSVDIWYSLTLSSFKIIVFIFNNYLLYFIVFQTLIPIIFGHLPAGSSVNTLLHFAQVLNSSKDPFVLFFSFSRPPFTLSVLQLQSLQFCWSWDVRSLSNVWSP